MLGEVVQFNLSDIGEGIKEVTVKVGNMTLIWMWRTVLRIRDVYPGS
jgi:hypothetical protein